MQHRVSFCWSSHSRSIPAADTAIMSDSPSTAWRTGRGPLNAVAAAVSDPAAPPVAVAPARCAVAAGAVLSADACAWMRTAAHQSAYSSRMLPRACLKVPRPLFEHPASLLDRLWPREPCNITMEFYNEAKGTAWNGALDGNATMNQARSLQDRRVIRARHSHPHTWSQEELQNSSWPVRRLIRANYRHKSTSLHAIHKHQLCSQLTATT